MLGVLIITVMLVLLAYSLSYDVWSLLISGVLWISALYFAGSGGSVPAVEDQPVHGT